MPKSSKPTRLLVVEDDFGLQRQLKWALDAYEVDCAATREGALAAVRRHEPAIVLQDLGLPPDPTGVEEGFATLLEIQRSAPTAKIIVVTGREGREHALRAISLGAHDFCEKPVDFKLLCTIIERAERIRQLEIENRRLAETRTASALDGLIVASDEMLKVCRTIQKVAPTDATVLLLGESGTGKERLAQALHALSARAAKPIIAINCAAIPESLLESELFGFEQGAFTGAVRQRIGKIEMAGGGTLFLDEIGDMPLALQAKLLRFLQERVVERIGGREPIPVDVRIVVATNCDLEDAIERGAFRKDLHYRISEIAVRIPPLRERESDAVLIANHLLKRCCRRLGRTPLRLSEDAMRSIESYSWPGNVRELENRINSAAILAEGRLISAADLCLPVPQPPAADSESEPMRLREVRQSAERQAVRRALAAAGGNLSKAAILLGITRPTLYDILNRTSTPHGH
ncbi:MAG: PEP-CTERM-box response regulator transcription factor [Gammaproteobacteria bacterium]|nr:PEP-CTERM-box response regulator transcription factor [Gammaproteobacteria bacterium]